MIFALDRGWRSFATTLLLVHLVLFSFALAKSATAGSPSSAKRSVAPTAGQASSGTRRCLDVELTSNGRLLGRCAETLSEPLVLRSADGRAVTLPCDPGGNFAVDGLHGGTYQLTSGEQSWLVRTWTAGTAPPCASRFLALKPSPLVVRGQWSPPQKVNKLARAIKYGGNNPLVVSGVLAAAVGIPVAVHNHNQDDNS